MECFVNYAEIGFRIRQIRKGRKWTQAKLAEAVGCSTANITNVEKAKTKLSLNMLVRIAEILEVSVDELVGTRKAAPTDTPQSLEAEIQAICAGLSTEKARLCQQVCVEFCAAVSRHLV